MGINLGHKCLPKLKKSPPLMSQSWRLRRDPSPFLTDFCWAPGIYKAQVLGEARFSDLVGYIFSQRSNKLSQLSFLFFFCAGILPRSEKLGDKLADVFNTFFMNLCVAHIYTRWKKDEKRFTPNTIMDLSNRNFTNQPAENLDKFVANYLPVVM